MNQQTEDRQMFDATCSNCGQATQVPFQPSGDKPVYCRDCFRQVRGNRAGGGAGRSSNRQMFDATCSNCGQATQVPFQPKEGRPVYCRDCFQKMKS